MKWSVPPAPTHGDKRWIRSFALMPKYCSDGTARWLCWVWERQQYVVLAGLFLYDAGWATLEYTPGPPAWGDAWK